MQYETSKERPDIVRKLPVVLIPVPLPLLRDPIGDVFAEGLKLEYGLRNSQIDELREKIFAGEVEVVFILDAYDELALEALGKNLWRSNNLEQYRDQSVEKKLKKKDGATNTRFEDVYAYPKVVFTCRSEYLTADKNYKRAFLPIESMNDKKDEEAEGGLIG